MIPLDYDPDLYEEPDSDYDDEFILDDDDLIEGYLADVWKHNQKRLFFAIQGRRWCM